MTYPGAEPLTQRERQVVVLVAMGFDRPLIAMRLNISVHTVNDYLKRIFRKLGISRMESLIVFAFRFGFVTPADVAWPLPQES